MLPQQYCLRWKHHHSNVQNMFAQLLEKERFCDVTLYCSPSFATQVPNKDTVDPQNIRGVSLRAHRVVLAACSELLGALLGAHEAQGEPVLVIDGAEPKHLKALLDYMYTGEMNVHHSQLASLLKTAEELRIKGLTDIRWNNKDEPPDCEPGVVATATPADPKQQADPKVAKQPSPKHASPKHASPKRVSTPRPIADHNASELRTFMKKEQEISENEIKQDKCNVNEHSLPTSKVDRIAAELRTNIKMKQDIGDIEINIEKRNANGGPPPLIKLPTKDKSSPTKRENSDSDSPSPKRQRFVSGTEHTDDDSLGHIKSERDQEWQHGNLDISAERVVGWGAGDSSRDASDDEWADAPADIGSFLHTRLRVDGDNSADEESNESACGGVAAASSSSSAPSELHISTHTHGPKQTHQNDRRALEFERTCEAFGFNIARMEETATSVVTAGPKSGPTDPRFTDVVKLSDYLQHGRRPQFWEEPYVKRVMEAVRVKELEMKQAAEILGVSYGTLYGRYRDVYGCINRPYRGVREFWQSKGPSEVLEQLQRGDITLDAAARALGVSIANLAAHVADFGLPEKDFEPIPIEVDPSLKMRPRTYSIPAAHNAAPTGKSTRKPVEKPIKKILIGSLNDEDPIPATVITTHEGKFNATPTTTTVTPTATTTCGKWPSIRVASLDTLRGGDAPPPSTPTTTSAPSVPSPAPPSPCALMRTRPDLTIVAARKPDAKRDDDST